MTVHSPSEGIGMTEAKTCPKAAKGETNFYSLNIPNLKKYLQ